jgi:hypothetical protein
MVNTFEGLLGVLVDNRVRFTLVGGLAVSLNGFVRTTEDMDILVDDDPSNVKNLLNCLLQFGEGYARELNLTDFADEEGAVRIQEAFDLDIFVRMRGKKYQDLIKHIQYYEMVGGANIPYLDADGLIRLKGDSSREKDRIDAAALRRIARDTAHADGKITNLTLDSLRADPPPSSAGPTE